MTTDTALQTIADTMAQAFGHYQAGRLTQAESLCSQVLAAQPDHVDALHVRGVVRRRMGDPQAAIQFISRAWALNPQSVEVRYNLGNAQVDAGDFDGAIAGFAECVRLKPDHAQALFQLTNLYLRRRDCPAALAYGKRLLALDPNHPEGLTCTASATLDLGNIEEAIGYASRAAALRPDLAAAHNCWANALLKAGRIEEAERRFNAAAAASPGYWKIYNDLGNLYFGQERHAEAEAQYRKALAGDPAYADAWCNLGNCLHEVKRFEEAAEAYTRALDANPNLIQALVAISNTLNELKRTAEGVAMLERALALDPDHPEALALSVHRQQSLASWKDIDARKERLRRQNRAGNGTLDPFILINIATTPEEQYLAANRWNRARFESLRKAGAAAPFAHRPRDRQRIALGYLSADVRVHPVAHLVAQIIELHDRKDFSVTVYSYGPDDNSAMRARIRDAADRFVDLRPLSIADGARRIHADEIDILIDLTGYTKHSRTGTLAMRPAPVQVNWLGYPGTLGDDMADYIVVDPVTVPLAEQPHFAERLVQMPFAYQPNDRRRFLPTAASTRAECGLPEAGMVYCCFNNPQKIEHEMFDVWMRVLKAVPGSVLWLLALQAEAIVNMRREAEARGVAPDRLVFAPMVDNDVHMARYLVADLFLDTLPYNAHTTASDSLWAGCPILTTPGIAFPGRVASALIRASGLDELIVPDLRAYEAEAIRLGNDRQALGRLRERVAAARTTGKLFDSERFARDLEQAYRRMWRRWRAGQPPEQIVLAAATTPPTTASPVPRRNPHPAPERLNRMQIEITTGCNLSCSGCQRTIGLAAGTWRNVSMPVGRFETILRNCPPAEVLVLQGIGEPTQHKHLPKLIRHARKTGKFRAISFNTNALLRDREYYRALQEAGLNHISISVDSLVPATAEATRGGTDAELLRQRIGELIALFAGNVTLSVVLSRLNLPELDDLLVTLIGLGGRNIEIQPLIGYSDAIDPVLLRPEDIAQALAIITTARARAPGVNVIAAPGLTPNGSRCSRPLRAGYVTVEGYVTPCCTTNDIAQFGRTSLLKQSFAEAWQAAPVISWFERFAAGDPDICVGCAYNPSAPPFSDPDAAERAATALLAQNKLAEAEVLFRALANSPRPGAGLHGLGLVCNARGQFGDGVRLLKAAVGAAPSGQYSYNLAHVLVRAGQRDEAVAVLRKAIADHPEYKNSYIILANLYEAAGERAQAADVLLALCRRAQQAGAFDLIEPLLPKLLELGADRPGLGPFANILRMAGRRDLASVIFDRIVAERPEDLGIRLHRAIAQLPAGYASEAEIVERRRAYAAALDDFAARVEMATPEALASAANEVGLAKPFYLSYQGQNDRPLQAIYGKAIARIMRTSIPVPPPVRRKRQPGERIRVGFATHYFGLHSVSKLFTGWMKHLDRRRFEVFGYALAADVNEGNSPMAAACDRFRGGLGGEPRPWVDAIAADAPDILIYPEIGMEALTVKLACLRLAPVQCVSWGHPVTTGIDTIDHFLTSDLMEPPGAQEAYTENLVRLPGLSVYYEPLPTGGDPLPRASLNLADDAVVFICCQSLFKYLPRHDWVFTRIAAAVPKAQFLMIGEAAYPLTLLVRGRIERALAGAGLDPARHLAMVPPVPVADFPRMLRAGDVYLDSVGWSGGNTTLEAITCGLPVVTMRGDLMRGCHSAAILQFIGLGDQVAADPDAYVERAVRLASDPKARQAAARAVVVGRERLYRDLEPVRALETLIERWTSTAERTA